MAACVWVETCPAETRIQQAGDCEVFTTRVWRSSQLPETDRGLFPTFQCQRTPLEAGPDHGMSLALSRSERAKDERDSTAPSLGVGGPVFPKLVKSFTSSAGLPLTLGVQSPFFAGACKKPHTHRFVRENGATLIQDEVLNRLPLWPIGELAHPLIELHLNRMLGFRARAIRKALGVG